MRQPLTWGLQTPAERGPATYSTPFSDEIFCELLFLTQSLNTCRSSTAYWWTCMCKRCLVLTRALKNIFLETRTMSLLLWHFGRAEGCARQISNLACIQCVISKGPSFWRASACFRTTRSNLNICSSECSHGNWYEKSGPNSQLQWTLQEAPGIKLPDHRNCKTHELSDHMAAWMTKMGKVRFYRHRISQDGGHISKCPCFTWFYAVVEKSGNLALASGTMARLTKTPQAMWGSNFTNRWHDMRWPCMILHTPTFTDIPISRTKYHG